MRRAFTLIELLVTITIIAILAGLSLATLQSARQTTRAAKTKATIGKLHNIVMERYESYRYRRLSLDVAQHAKDLGLDYENTHVLARLRLYAIRDLMRMEMPERRQDILSLSLTGIPEPAVHRSLRNWIQAMEQKESWREFTHIEAEIFYAWVTIGNPEAREQFSSGEVGDTDGDRALEFLDGWGKPIYFLRWPVQFTDSDIQIGDPISDHDPFDSRQIQVKAFRTMPLVYSAGPDGIYGIDVRPNIDYGISPIVDPYRWPVGKAIDSGGHLDNIHNHRLAP